MVTFRQVSCADTLPAATSPRARAPSKGFLIDMVLSLPCGAPSGATTLGQIAAGSTLCHAAGAETRQGSGGGGETPDDVLVEAHEERHAVGRWNGLRRGRLEEQEPAGMRIEVERGPGHLGFLD